MQLLDDMCHMESLYGLFRNSVSFGARYVHSSRLMHHILRTILEAPVGTSLKRVKWKLGLICLEIVLIFMEDRCAGCMEHTICLEINLDTPGRTP